MGTNDAHWGFWLRVLFRFVFVYFILYLLPFPLNVLPYQQILTSPYAEVWNWIVPWVGKLVFQVDVPMHPSGSGDMTYNYVQLFCFVVMALVATAAWTLLDRRAIGYPRLDAWLRWYVRFALGGIMISYGAYKLIKSQFPFPSVDALMQPLGDSSPMGLLWKFMGASEGYNIFTGGAEMLGGLLLTTRRTTLLGALVCAGVLSNVIVLNFCYDVPVKLYSCHLFALALFLAAPDVGRLANLFLFNRGIEPAETCPLFQRKWLERGSVVLRTVLVAGFTGMMLFWSYQARRANELAPKSPLYGVWNVEHFEVDGKVRPALVTDSARWRRVIFDYPKFMAIQSMNDSRALYRLELDTGTRSLLLTRGGDPGWKSVLSYEQPEPEVLALEGTMEGLRMRAKLRLASTPEFLLTSRGFHWINEYPFNH